MIKNITKQSKQENPIHSVIPPQTQVELSTSGNTSSDQLLKNWVKISTRKLKTKNIKGKVHTIVLSVKKWHTTQPKKKKVTKWFAIDAWILYKEKCSDNPLLQFKASIVWTMLQIGEHDGPKRGRKSQIQTLTPQKKKKEEC